MIQFPSATYQYVVQAGDSMWLIAQRLGVSPEAIAAANPGVNPRSLFVGQILCIPAAPAASAPAAAAAAALPPSAPEPSAPVRRISAAELRVNNALRMLWEQHVYWTRLYIVSAVFGLPDTQATAARLMRNPADFAAALTPFYGGKTAAQFEQLFAEHLRTAAELIGYLKAGNSAAAADAEKRWYSNAAQIASFLSGINPYWQAGEWRRLLDEHLALTRDEAAATLAGQYAQSVAIFDNIEKEALEMADAMTQGLTRQFPQFFGQ
jgi:LysM repeat protein